jgi:hypothetical protein
MSPKTSAPIPARPLNFIVRFPPGMRSRIADLANKYRQTMYEEIHKRLHESLIQDGGTYAESMDDFSSPYLSKHELELLRSFRHLKPQQQKALVTLISRK